MGWCDCAGCSLMAQEQASLLDSRMTAILLAMVLPKLGPGDLARLACTCRGLQELAGNASADAWRRTLTGLLPCSHPALQPHAQGLTSLQLRAAAMQYHRAQDNAANIRFNFSPPAEYYFLSYPGPPMLLPDGQYMALVVEGHKDDWWFLLCLHAMASVTQVAEVSEPTPEPWARAWCRFESDSCRLRLVLQYESELALPYVRQLVRIYSVPELEQLHKYTVNLPVEGSRSFYPPHDGQHVVHCTGNAAYCCSLIQGQQPPVRQTPLGSCHRSRGVCHQHLPLYALPELSGGHAHQQGFGLSIHSMEADAAVVQAPVTQGTFYDMAWSGHTAAVLACKQDFSITVLDTNTGVELYHINSACASDRPGLAVSQKGVLAVMCESRLQVWSRPSCQPDFEHEPARGCMKFSPAGNFLVLTGDPAGCHFFDVRNNFNPVKMPVAFKTASSKFWFDMAGEHMILFGVHATFYPVIQALNFL